MVGASLAIEHEAAPVQSLNDIVGSNYKLVISKGGSIEAYFWGAKPGTTPHQIVEANKVTAEPYTGEIWLRWLMDGTLPDDTLVFAAYQPLQYSSAWSCDISSINVDYRKMGNGLIFQKNWPFKAIINNELLKLKEEGYLDGLQKKYSHAYRNNCYKRPINATTVADTISLFTLIAIGIFSSALMLVIEIVASCYIIKNTPSLGVPS